MSMGQLLLTIGVALCVFDAKKMPMLITTVVRIVSVFRQYYCSMAATVEQAFQQTLDQQTLLQNELKAKQAED